MCTLVGTVLLGVGTARASDRPDDITAEEAHAFRLHDEYVRMNWMLRNLEGRRTEIIRDQSQVATPGLSGGVVEVTYGYSHDLAVLAQRIADHQKQMKELETLWDQKYAGRFGPLSAALVPFTDPATKKATGLDTLEWRLRNYSFNPATPRPPAGTPAAPPRSTPAATPAAAVAGTWQLIDSQSKIDPPGKSYTGSAEAIDGKISVRTAPTDPKWARLVYAGVISWVFNGEKPTTLRPGETLTGLVTFTNTGREFVAAGYNPSGSLRFQRSSGGDRVNFFEMKSTELPAPEKSVSRTFSVKIPEVGRDASNELHLVAKVHAGRTAEFTYRYRWVPK